MSLVFGFGFVFHIGYQDRKDLDLALFFILDIKTEKIIEKCPEKCPETANYYTTADRWQMNFNPTKCEVMRISHNKDNRSTRCNISGTVLRNVSTYKDLGVIMASDLKWSKHVEQIVHTANRVLGLLKRTVGSKNKDFFQICTKPWFVQSWNTLARCGHHT